MVVKVQRSMDGNTVLIYTRDKSICCELPYKDIKGLRLPKGGKAYYSAHIEGTLIALDTKLCRRMW